jgi:hypothetical protein
MRLRTVDRRREPHCDVGPCSEAHFQSLRGKDDTGAGTHANPWWRVLAPVTSLRPDNDVSAEIYGRRITVREIVLGPSNTVPLTGRRLVDVLQKKRWPQRVEGNAIAATTTLVAGLLRERGTGLNVEGVRRSSVTFAVCTE